MAKRSKVEVLIEVDDQGAVRKITGINQKLDQTASSAGSLASALKGAAGIATAALGAIAGAAAITGKVVWDLTRQAADYGDELVKASQKVGVTVEALSSLRYAADLSNVSMTSLETALARLSRNAADAGRGTGDARLAFQTLGISVRDASGALRPVDELLGDIADRFERMRDGTEKAAFAQQLFGRSGTELIPLLNQGRRGLTEMREEAERLGVVLGGEQARQAERFNDNLRRMDHLVLGLKMSIGNALIPVFNSLIESFIRSGSAINSLQSFAREATATLLAMGVRTADLTITLSRFDAALRDMEIGFAQGLLTNPSVPDAIRAWASELVSSAAAARKTATENAELARVIRNELDRALADFLLGRNRSDPNKPKQDLDDIANAADRVAQKIGRLQMPDLRAPGTLFRPAETFFRSAEAAFAAEELDRMVRDLPAHATSIGGLDPRSLPIPPGGTLGAGPMPAVGGSAAGLIDLPIERLQQMAAQLRQIWGDAFRAREALAQMVPPEVFAGLDAGLQKQQNFQTTLATYGELFSSSFTLIAQGVQQGGLALVAALSQVVGMVLSKLGLHLLGQGLAEIALGTAPPPFGPRPDLIAHGTMLKKTGTILTAIGTGASVAGSALGAVAGATGRGGPPGSAFNPVRTAEAPGGTAFLDLSGRSQQALTVARLEAEIARLNGQLSRMASQPAGVVTLEGTKQAGGSVAVIRSTGGLPDLSGWMHDEPIVR